MGSWGNARAALTECDSQTVPTATGKKQSGACACLEDDVRGYCMQTVTCFRSKTEPDKTWSPSNTYVCCLHHVMVPSKW